MKQIRLLLVSTFLAIVLVPAFADKRASSDKKQSFEEFRKGILNDYAEFKNTLLEHYADFLNGEWHEYESLNAEKRDKTPKPKRVPVYDKSKPQVEPSGSNVKPSDPESIPSAPQQSPSDNIPAPVIDKNSSKVPEVIRSEDNANVNIFDFYGLPVQIPLVEFSISDHLYSNSDYANHWRSLDDSNVAGRLIPHITSLAKMIGLNDYLTYQLINSYVDSKFPNVHNSAKMSLIHYLLANMGYDARLAVTENNIPVLLLPADQTIYARTYGIIDRKKYYHFYPTGVTADMTLNKRFYTPKLPDNVEKGNDFAMKVGELNVPDKPKHFDFRYGALHISGDVNENLMPILLHYPQIPVSGFAESNIQPALRKQIVEQVKSQLADMEGDQAVEELLHFTQNAFTYATDEEFHGFEKPYFFEEILYYPKNDCEDRAIFYTYLLWNALGRESQLVNFPGHQAATVRMDHPVDGVSYQYNGITFYMSDPTYIGAPTGRIMPQYQNTKPNIDKTYSSER